MFPFRSWWKRETAIELATARLATAANDLEEAVEESRGYYEVIRNAFSNLEASHRAHAQTLINQTESANASLATFKVLVKRWENRNTITGGAEPFLPSAGPSGPTDCGISITLLSRRLYEIDMRRAKKKPLLFDRLSAKVKTDYAVMAREVIALFRSRGVPVTEGK